MSEQAARPAPLPGASARAARQIDLPQSSWTKARERLAWILVLPSLLVVFLVALALRAAFLGLATAGPGREMWDPDSHEYARLGRNLALHGVFSQAEAPPLIPDRQRLPLFNGPISAIVRKDLRVLPRDIQQLSQFIFPLAIAFFWIWRLMSDSNRDFSALRQTQPFADFGLITIGLFVCILITNHLGLTGLSREGNSYWLLHLAPLDPWNIVWAKWLLAWLPFPVIGSLFVALIGLLQRPPLTVLLQNWLLLQVTGVGVAGITAGLGAVFPKFDWQQPRRMTSRRGGCLGSSLYLIYTALMLALTIGAQLVALRFGSWAIAAGWGSAIVLTLVALGVPLWFGARRLRRLEW